jgi:DNA gyrase/topoisomerase IV subunit B
VETLNKKNKGANIKPFMVKNYLSVFINCMIENPAFESQACYPRMERQTLLCSCAPRHCLTAHTRCLH